MKGKLEEAISLKSRRYVIILLVSVCFSIVYTTYTIPNQIQKGGVPYPNPSTELGTWAEIASGIWLSCIGFLVISILLSILLFYTHKLSHLYTGTSRRSFQYFSLYLAFFLIGSIIMTIGFIFIIKFHQSFTQSVWYGLVYPVTLPLAFMYSSFAPFFLFKFSYWVAYQEEPSMRRKLSVLLPLAALLLMMTSPYNWFGCYRPVSTFPDYRVVTDFLLLLVNLTAIIQSIFFVSVQIRREKNITKRARFKTILVGLLSILSFFIFNLGGSLYKPYSFFAYLKFITASVGLVVLFFGVAAPYWYLLEVKERKLKILHRWARRLNKAEDMDAILEYTLDAMDKVLGFKYGMIYLKRDNYLTFERSIGYEIPKKYKKLSLNEKGVTVKAVNQGKTILVPNVRNEEAYIQGDPIIQSELAVPIKIEGEAVGVLNVESGEADDFNKLDKRLLETLASHVGVALSELRKKKRLISVKRLHELRNRFLTMAAHEINTPLTPIKTRLQMLRKEYHGALTDKQDEVIAETLQSLDRLIQLVDDFCRVSDVQPLDTELKKRTHRLENTIEKALRDPIMDAIIEKRILLEKHIPESIPAVYDEDKMIQLIQNLVENAIDYTKDRIWIEAGECNGKAWLSVRDNGRGIPEDEQEKIFNPFYRVEEERSREYRRFGGSGLGLTICKRIIEAHDGEIKVDSTPGEGTTFTIVFPRNKE